MHLGMVEPLVIAGQMVMPLVKAELLVIAGPLVMALMKV